MWPYFIYPKVDHRRLVSSRHCMWRILPTFRKILDSRSGCGCISPKCSDPAREISFREVTYCANKWRKNAKISSNFGNLFLFSFLFINRLLKWLSDKSKPKVLKAKTTSSVPLPVLASPLTLKKAPLLKHVTTVS